MNRRHAILPLFLSVALYCTLGLAATAHAAPFTLVVLPDTQYYVSETPRKQGKLTMFQAEVQWIIDNRASRNIAFVLHEGDLVDNRDPVAGQWNRARPIIKSLDGVVPYALAPGNHDVWGPEREAWEFNSFFPFREFQDWPELGGVFEAAAGVLNAYYLFQAGDLNWLIFALEPFPRDSVLAWVNRVAEVHPTHNIIVVTHSHVYPDDTLVGSSPSHEYTCTEYSLSPLDGSGNNGLEVWNKCLRRHRNVLMTFSGHVGGSDLETSAGLVVGAGDHGNKVYQMSADYQETWSHGLFGHLRIVTVDPDRKTISVQTYSPYMDQYGTGPRSQFSFEKVAFTAPGPTVAIAAPRGVVWWQTGTQQMVTWTTRGKVGDVNIDLSTDGGITWARLARGAANSGAQAVTVPDTPSTQCLVRVSGTGGFPAETSNAAFTIARTPPITGIAVALPYARAVWEVGTQQTVCWTSQAFAGRVNIELSTNGGETWAALGTGLPASGLLAVTVPDRPSAQCLVRASGTEGSPRGLSARFQIAAPPPAPGTGAAAP